MFERYYPMQSDPMPEWMRAEKYENCERVNTGIRDSHLEDLKKVLQKVFRK